MFHKQMRQKRPFLDFELNEIHHTMIQTKTYLFFRVNKMRQIIIQIKLTCSSAIHYCPGERPFWLRWEKRFDFRLTTMRLSIQTCKNTNFIFLIDISTLIISYLLLFPIHLTC